MSEFKLTAEGEIWAYFTRGENLPYEDKRKRSEALERLLNALERNASDEEIHEAQQRLKMA